MALDLIEMELDQLLAKANLENEICGLRHTSDDPAKNHPAVDYLCQRMGYKLSEGESVADAEIRIPICKDCIDALYSGEWILFYCLYCGESSWALRGRTKHDFPKDVSIVGFRSCPNCKKDDGRIN